jgi:hypothetical protein
MEELPKDILGLIMAQTGPQLGLMCANKALRDFCSAKWAPILLERAKLRPELLVYVANLRYLIPTGPWIVKFLTAYDKLPIFAAFINNKAINNINLVDRIIDGWINHTVLTAGLYAYYNPYIKFNLPLLKAIEKFFTQRSLIEVLYENQKALIGHDLAYLAHLVDLLYDEYNLAKKDKPANLIVDIHRNNVGLYHHTIQLLNNESIDDRPFFLEICKVILAQVSTIEDYKWVIERYRYFGRKMFYNGPSFFQYCSPISKYCIIMGQIDTSKGMETLDYSEVTEMMKIDKEHGQGALLAIIGDQ